MLPIQSGLIFQLRGPEAIEIFGSSLGQTYVGSKVCGTLLERPGRVWDHIQSGHAEIA